MESRSAARGRAAWAVRNHLLSDRKAHLRQCRSCTRRIFPAPGSVAGSATETTRRENKSVVCDNSVVAAAVPPHCLHLRVRTCALHSNLNPHVPDGFTIFHGNHVRFLPLILPARDGSGESTRSAQRNAEQNDRDLCDQVHGLIPSLSPVFQPEACPKRRR